MQTLAHLAAARSIVPPSGSVFTALNVQNRVQLAILAYDAGLLDDAR